MYLNRKFINKIRNNFPYFKYNKLYLDNASTTQKPINFINSISNFYKNINSNINRGNYKNSILVSELVNLSRKEIKKFINAKRSDEIIFTSGTTDSINFIANSIRNNIKFNSKNIIISELEHHSNIIPWQILCKNTNTKLIVIPVNKYGELNINYFEKLISNNTIIVSISHISNVLGIINPIEKIINISHKYNSLVLIDGAQAISHINVDVTKLNVDYYVFSAHKMFGSMGVGILYGKYSLLKKLNIIKGGGGIVKKVNKTYSTYINLPWRLEPGTPNIAGIISLYESIKFINKIGIFNIINYEKRLLYYTIKKLNNKIPNIIIYGQKNIDKHIPIISFNIRNYIAYDIDIILSNMGVSLRSGQHCAQLLMKSLNIHSTLRISLCIYNTYKEIDTLCSYIINTLFLLK